MPGGAAPRPGWRRQQAPARRQRDRRVRTATTKLRTGSTDHKAEAVPHTRRHPSSIAATRKLRVSLIPLADRTKPAAHSPAAETSAAMPRGSTTRSGNKIRAAVSRPASHHAAMRWATRFCKNGKDRDREPSARGAGKVPPVRETGSEGFAALTKDRFRSWRKRRRSPAPHSRASRTRGRSLLRSTRRNPSGWCRGRRSPGLLLP